MTPRPAQPDRRKSVALAATLAAACVVFVSGAAEAKPLDLSTEAGIVELARWVEDYRGVVGARWVIAAPDQAQADAKRAALGEHLPVRDLSLLQKVDVQIVAGGAPRAWMAPVVGGASATSKCAWQVWVADPATPSPDDETVMTPLQPNDRISVSTTATFRVGHAGLVQSHLYAFGETRAGAVRDLASAPDVNIPVSHDPDGETIVLAAARQASPFLESVKTALSQSQGERIELGARYRLSEATVGGARGIGANIQAIPDNMIAAADPKPSPSAAGPERGASGLLEACLYRMTPRL